MVESRVKLVRETPKADVVYFAWMLTSLSGCGGGVSSRRTTASNANVAPSSFGYDS